MFKSIFLIFSLFVVTVARADTSGPIAAFYERLTPQGRAKLGVTADKLAPTGHEIARVFLAPLAKNGPLSASKIQTETATPERIAKNRMLAERLMKHQVELLGGYPVQELGTPIDWFRAPDGDRQWPTHLSRHYYLMPLAYAYHTTHDDKYAREAVSWLLEWIEKFPLNSPELENSRNSWGLRYAENKNPQTQQGVFKGYVDGPWTALSAEKRVESWTQLFQLIYDAPALDNRSAAIILNSLTGDQRQIMMDYPLQMNQFQAVAGSLILTGLYFPDFVGSSEAEQTGWQRLKQHAEREIYLDGAMAEVSPNYGMGMVGRLNEMVELGHEFKRPIPEVLTSRLSAARHYFAMIADPLGRSPRIAKGGNNMLNSLRNLNRVAPDPEVAFVASEGKEGQMPALNQSFAWVGHHVFRSNWTPSATWMFFDTGPRGTGHHDIAQGGVQLMSNGEMLLTDPGFYSYSGQGENGAFSGYFKTTAAHNAALVDGEGQISYATGTRAGANVQPGDYGWKNTPAQAEAQGVYTYGFGAGGKIKVLHRRKVQWLPAQNTFVISDTFENQDGSAAPHDIALMWQLAPGAQTQIGTDAVAVERPKARMKMEFSGAPNAKIEQFVGQKKPFIAGWFSEEYGKLEAAPTLRVSTRSALPLTITTRLIVEKK